MSNNNKKLSPNLPDADYRTYRPGQVIARYPSTQPPMYGVITRGTVSCVYHHPDHPEKCSIHYMESGDWIGIDSVDCKCCAGASIRWTAEEICVVAFIPVAKFKDYQAGMDICESIIASLVRQKRRAVEEAMVASLPGAKRIERRLMDIARSCGVETKDGLVIDPISKTNLASSVNVSREFASRHLKKLKEEGKIEMYSKRIIIKTKTLGV